MREALFLNGVFRRVLEEIVQAQAADNSLVCYLQPYADTKIVELSKKPPSPADPKMLYVSTSDSLAEVSYVGRIVGWEDKRSLLPDRRSDVDRQIVKHQPGEGGLYPTAQGKVCVNLLSVRGLKRVPSPFRVELLAKTVDDTPLKPRTRAGRWPYVYELPGWVGTSREVYVLEVAEQELEAQVARSLALSPAERKKRLIKASRIPKKKQIISQEYYRNPDVIAEVLLRAKGQCEQCGASAPFTRASDGSPYLEVHHRVWLSAGGEDTVENAMAVCPDCHREKHYGVSNQAVEAT